MKKITLSIALIFSVINNLKAQDSNNHIPNIIPPAPSVNNLMKFEEVPVSHYTGVPDISIPITSMSTGLNNVNIDLALKYHSLSLKPDDRAGEAGIGWSLFAGGTISRTVVDVPDEIETISVSNNSSKHKFGIYFDETSGVATQNINYTKTFINAIPTTDLTLDNENFRKLLYEAYYQNKFDMSYDLYQYSFLNYSGRFIVRKINGVLTPVSLDKNNLKIKCNHTSNTINSFEITDEYGNKFLFDIKETSNTNFFSYTKNVMSGDNINTGYSSPYVSSYHLSSIKDTSDIEFVSLKYYPEKTISISNVSRIIRDYEIPMTFDIDQLPYANSSLPKREETTSNNVTTKTRQLEEIQIKDKGRLTLEYDFGRQDNNYDGSLIGNLPRLKEIKTYNSSNLLIEKNTFFHNYENGYNMLRLTLQSLKKYDRNNNLIAEYNLEYHPYQSDMIEDAWKYLKCNDLGYSYRDNCVSAGQLKSMTLPTKGKIEFDYEANTYAYQPDSENFSANTVEITNFNDNELNWDPISSNVVFNNFTSGEKFAFVIDEPVQVSFNFDFDILTQNNYQWYLKVLKKNGSTYTQVAGTGPGLDPAGNPNGYTIPPIIFTSGEYYLKLEKYSPGSVPNFNVSVNLSYKIKNLNDYRYLHGGGVRIKRIKYYDHITGPVILPSKMMEYSYSSPDNIKKSSGALVFPKPLHEYRDLYTYGFFYYAIPDSPFYYWGNNVINTTSKDNFLNVQKTKGGDVGYQYVVEREIGKGKTLLKFSSPIDYPNLSLPTFRPPFLPAENYDFRRGNILNKKVYKENQADPIVEEIFEYNEIVTETVPLGVGLRFISQQTYDEFFYGSVFKTFEEYKNAHDNDHIVVNGQMMVNPYKPFCLTQTKDTYNFIAYYPKKEIIGKTNLTKHTVINYFPNQKSSTQTTTNTYNVRDYITKKTVEFPDNSVQETTYKYAHEKGNQLMIGKNMIGIPLETETKQTINGTTKTLSKTETVYPTSVPTTQTGNLVLPVSVLSFNLQSGSPETEVTFDKYDSKGNLLQYTTKSGIPVAVVWGYNGTKPIAKVEGATYDQVSGLQYFSEIISKSDEDIDQGSENILISTLDNFRNLNSRFYISTYTYDPLIGVTSITPPSGIREIYIYDTANRLEKIVDVEGKVLKEFKYNYKN